MDGGTCPGRYGADCVDLCVRVVQRLFLGILVESLDLDLGQGHQEGAMGLDLGVDQILLIGGDHVMNSRTTRGEAPSLESSRDGVAFTPLTYAALSEM